MAARRRLSRLRCWMVETSLGKLEPTGMAGVEVNGAVPAAAETRSTRTKMGEPLSPAPPCPPLGSEWAEDRAQRTVPSSTAASWLLLRWAWLGRLGAASAVEGCCRHARK